MMKKRRGVMKIKERSSSMNDEEKETSDED
jgi:hypothetical protein